MHYSNPQIRLIARRIPILCALYFVVFCFLYLILFQRDVLAQVQFEFSHGANAYHPLLSAVLCTILLSLVGFAASGLLSWLPLRMKALPWFVPFLLLGALTHWHFPYIGDIQQAPGWGAYLVLLFAYGCLLMLGFIMQDSFKERQTFFAYAWPNALILILFTTICVWLSNTNDLSHQTLTAARYIGNGDDGKAIEVVKWQRHPSHQISAMTALALSRSGQLGEQLFAFPQPHGSEGLLPIEGDTLLFVNVRRIIGEHLGYKRGKKISATRFLEVTDTMPKSHVALRDYLLSAYLLDRNLTAFRARLLKPDAFSKPYTGEQADSLFATLPKHYREALLLQQHLHPQATDTLCDSHNQERLREFIQLMESTSKADEREFACRNLFPDTYWCYYYFGDR